MGNGKLNIKKINLFLRIINRDEIFNNAFYSLAIKILSVFLAYFFNFYISRKYGAVSIGILNVAVSFMSLFSVMAVFGFDQVILRLFAQYSDNIFALKKIYFKVAVFVVLISIFFSSLMILYSKTISIYLLKSEGYRTMIFFVAVTIPFLAINSINVEAIRGLKLVKDSELFRMFYGSLINLIVFFLLLTFVQFNNFIPVLSTIIGTLFTSILSSWFLIRKLKLDSGLGNEPYIRGKDLLSISIPMLIIAASNIFTNYIPVYILAYLKSPKDVGIYNIAFKIATVTSFFLVSINSIVAPKFAELYWSNKTKELKKTVLKSAKLNFWSSTPVLLPFIFFPKFFMGLFGIEFVEGYRSLIILSIGQFVNAFCGSVGYLLTMTGNQDVFRNIYFISTILNLLLCFILIPLLGVDGAALSFSISMIFWNVLSLIIVKKKFGFVTYYLPFLKNE